MLAVAAIAGTLAAPAGATSLGSQSLLSFSSTTKGSNPREVVLLHGTRYFVADDGDHGTELFRSTGSGPATLVKDIAPGGTDADPRDLTTDGDALYFEATDGANGYELWTSDGTAAGTRALTSLDASDSGALTVLGAFDGHVYFAAADAAHGSELWSSDGTAAGTGLLKDIAPGTAGSVPSTGTVAGHQLFFTANDGVHGRELWVTDGTATGTTLTADLNSGAAGTNIYDISATGDDVYFNGSFGTATMAGEPFTSDGTQAGTHLVKDLETSAWYTSNTHDFVAFNGAVYFSGTTQAGGQQLYETDGTAANTSKVLSIAYGRVENLTVVGGALYFTADDGTHGNELWTSDGSAGGTHMVADLAAGGDDSEPSALTAAGGALYFAADDGVHGYELFTTDGTQAGTRLVSDIAPGAAGANVYDPIWDGTELWFQADDGTHGPEAWTTDGSAAGTTSHPLSTQGEAEIDEATRAGDELVAPYYDGTSIRLLATDGSTGATHLLTQVFQNASNFVSAGDKAYFQAYDGATGEELWVTDGTDAGTHIVIDLNTGSGSGLEGGPWVAGGKVYFTSREDSSSVQLWTTDGTAAGTVAVTDDSQLEWVDHVAAYGSKVVFSAAESGSGNYQAWVSDGTAGGTHALVGAGMSSSGSDPGDFGVLDGRIYFAGDSQNDRELYVSDGTSAGTQAIGSGLGAGNPDDFVAGGGKLYYIADQPPYGRQLHVTDGTAAGTHLVKAIGPGQYYQGPRDMTPIGGRLAFTAGGASGVWITDGTEAGTTQLVTAAGERPALRRVGDRVYFAGLDDAHGTELWATDGTAAGTAPAADLVAGAGSSHPQVLGDIDGRAIALGDAPGSGSVLYGIDAWPSDPVTTTTPATPAATPAPAPAAPAAPKPAAPATGRQKARSLSLAVTGGKTDHVLPFRYVVSGTLKLPAGVAKAKGCAGSVTLRLRRGDAVVASVKVKLAKDCTYKAVVTKSTRKHLLARGGSLRLAARFNGNTVLLPARATAATVRYGAR